MGNYCRRIWQSATEEKSPVWRNSLSLTRRKLFLRVTLSEYKMNKSEKTVRLGGLHDGILHACKCVVEELPGGDDIIRNKTVSHMGNSTILRLPFSNADVLNTTCIVFHSSDDYNKNIRRKYSILQGDNIQCF